MKMLSGQAAVNKLDAADFNNAVPGARVEAGAVIAYVERLTSIVTASAQPREDGLVGRAEAFNQALAALQRAAPSQIPVLLQGESGTGKVCRAWVRVW